MNSIEIESARQQLLESTKQLPPSVLDRGFFKDVKIDDEYSAAICISPTHTNSGSLAIFKNSDSGQQTVLFKTIKGENAKSLSSELLEDVFNELDRQN